VSDPRLFDGLFGVFNDRLPDGWGRLLLDRTVEKLGIVRQDLTPLDRLAHVGASGMGALSYDLTFSSGPGGEQSMLVMGEGRSPGLEHLRALAKKHDLRKREAIIDEVRAAIAQWPKLADAAGLTQKAAKPITDRIAPRPPKSASKSKTQN
jgi:hypothetical protein